MSKDNKTQTQNLNKEENKNKETEEYKDTNENKKDNSKSKKFTSVRFLKSYTPYIKGETVGLDPEEASDLVKKGICKKL